MDSAVFAVGFNQTPNTRAYNYGVSPTRISGPGQKGNNPDPKLRSQSVS